MANEHHHRAAALWGLTVETWLRRQGLKFIRQNQNQKVSTSFLKFWSQDQVGRPLTNQTPLALLCNALVHTRWFEDANAGRE